MSADFDLPNLLKRGTVIAALKEVIDQHENGVAGVSPACVARLKRAVFEAESEPTDTEAA